MKLEPTHVAGLVVLLMSEIGLLMLFGLAFHFWGMAVESLTLAHAALAYGTVRVVALLVQD